MTPNPPPPQWTFWTFHSATCRAQLEDPGARCVCRPGRREECACGSGCAPRTGCRSEPTQEIPFRSDP